MSVILRILEGLRMCRISGPYGSKVFSIDYNTAFLHQSIWSIPALYLYVPHEVFLIPLYDHHHYSCPYFRYGLICSPPFLFIQLAIAILIELFSDDEILPPNVPISIEVITYVRDSLSSSLLIDLSSSFFLFFGLAGA